MENSTCCLMVRGSSDGFWLLKEEGRLVIRNILSCAFINSCSTLSFPSLSATS